jgi:peptide/nickel transport system substrate-binding protein
VRALDRYTAEFILRQPYATFLKILVTPPAFIIPPEAAAFFGSSVSEHPVGTGPFRLAVWNRLEGITLVRNPSYWRADSLGRRLPFLQGVSVRLAGNPSLLVPEFLKGNSEVLVVDDPGLRQLQADPGFHRRFRVTTVPEGLTLRFFGITMNRGSILSRNPFLRRALAASFDREGLLRELHGLALEAASLPPRHLLGAAPAPRAGGPPPGVFPMARMSVGVTISTSIAAPDVDRMADAVRRCGLRATVQVRADGYYEHVVRDRPHLFRVSMQPVYPDPEEYYAMFWSKSPPTVNLSGYRSPAYDAVFERSMVEPDPERRGDLFRALETILRHDAPLILLTHEGPRHYVVPSYVRGFVLRSAMPDVALFWLDRHEDRLE